MLIKDGYIRTKLISEWYLLTAGLLSGSHRMCLFKYEYYAYTFVILHQFAISKSNSIVQSMILVNAEEENLRGGRGMDLGLTMDKIIQ